MTRDELALNVIRNLIKECKKEISSGILQESVEPKIKEANENEELRRYIAKQIVSTLKQVS